MRKSLISTKRLCLLTGIALLALIGANALHAQPLDKPIRLVVPYAPGGPIDVTARALAERVKDSLGVVIIDNKPGAGGNLGVDIVAKAPADGYTIGISAVATHAINPWLFTKMPFNAATDFAAITQMVRVPNVLVMNAETAQRLKINSVADLIAYGKANPGKLNIGSGGNGSAGHLAAEMFKRDAGIYAVHIPFNGGWPCCLAKSISTSTTWRQPHPTSRLASSRHWLSPRHNAPVHCLKFQPCQKLSKDLK
jgi:tripartite-type tricarboxylate transporter receptor subunit TctC